MPKKPALSTQKACFGKRFTKVIQIVNPCRADALYILPYLLLFYFMYIVAI